MLDDPEGCILREDLPSWCAVNPPRLISILEHLTGKLIIYLHSLQQRDDRPEGSKHLTIPHLPLSNPIRFQSNLELSHRLSVGVAGNYLEAARYCTPMIHLDERTCCRF